MRILLLTDGIYPYVIGGMQKHSYNLAKYLARHGVDVDLYHCVPFDTVLVKELEGFSNDELAKITHVCIHFPQPKKFIGHYLFESYEYSVRIYEHIKNKLNTYDFIYAKGFTAWKLLIEKGKGQQCPPVGVNFHGLEMYQKASSFKSNLEQILLKQPVKWNCHKADYVFSYGGKITEIIKKDIQVPGDKIIESPSGINIADSTYDEEKREENAALMKFIFVGRYERRKGIEELNNAIEELRHNFEFHFVGPIPEKLQLKSDKVKYWGAVMNETELKKIYKQCDVLVCPSHSEGMPNVIMEAMAQSLTVIATDVGAVRIMVNNETGWLLPRCDKNLIREAMKEAIDSSSEDLERKKKAAFNLISKKFDWDSIALRLIAELKQITSKRDTPEH